MILDFSQSPVNPGVMAFAVPYTFPDQPSNPQMPLGGVSLQGGYSTSTGIIGTSQDTVIPYRRATGVDGNLAGPQ